MARNIRSPCCWDQASMARGRLSALCSFWSAAVVACAACGSVGTFVGSLDMAGHPDRAGCPARACCATAFLVPLYCPFCPIQGNFPDVRLDQRARLYDDVPLRERQVVI